MKRLVALIDVCAMLLVTGCISRAVHNNVPQFAEAVTLATQNSQAAFEVVDRKYVDIEANRLVLDYDRTGFDPSRVHHLLAPKDLQVRLELLNALQRYASTLSDVSSDSKLQEFDSKAKALGQSLQTLTQTAEFKRMVKTTKTETDVAATAVDALGRWFIERKRQRELPKLIEQMQDPVMKTAELLETDIGNRPDDQGNQGNGLRAELWNEYMQAMVQQSAFIDHNKGQLDPLSKAQEIRKLPQLVDERDRADDHHGDALK